jgi:D-alanine transfer protein
VALLCSTWLAVHFERQFVRSFATAPGAAKVQGAAVARAAFRDPSLLPTYGSSAIALPWQNRPVEFFQEHARGFGVFPIAKPGTPLLIMQQRLAAIGASLKGKKVALIVSPAFFENIPEREHFYSGNFSRMHAFELAFGVILPRDVSSRAARRLVQFPATLGSEPLLRFGLGRLSRDRIPDRIALGMAWPLGRFLVATGRLQDHAEAILELSKEDASAPLPPPATLEAIDWDGLAAHWLPLTPDVEMPATPARAPGIIDEWYLERLNSSRAWEDFEILIATLRAVGAQEIVVSLPLPRVFWSHAGVSPLYQDAYYKWLEVISARCGAHMVELREHDRDPRFYRDNQEHPSAYGWLFGNRALDAFFHTPPPAPAPL